MKEVSLKDGTTLRIYAGNSTKPSSFGGQHTNDSAYWAKAYGYWWRLENTSLPKLIAALESLDDISQLSLTATKEFLVSQDEL